jgi:hypothetical protein
MNDMRSSAAFIAHVEQVADSGQELGLVAFKEQYLLNITRPVVHFGHARWREAEQEAADAAAWLADGPDRQLVVSESVRSLCFPDAQSQPLGAANRIEWFIVRGRANSDCVARGKATVAQHYTPPITHS